MLLLDEPTQGMSHSDTHDTEALIRGLSRDHGLSILLVEHDVELVMNLSDHVVVMHQGRIVEHGTARDVLLDPKEAYTRSLLAAAPASAGASSRARRGRARGSTRLPAVAASRTAGHDGGVGLWLPA